MEGDKKRHIDYEKLMSKNHNKGLIALILIVISGYIFFFLSPLLFHEKPGKELSPLNTEINFINGRIVINSWEYSRKQNVCEICCTTYGLNTDELELEAACNFDYKTKGSKPLQAAIGFKQSDYVVIYVFGIPEDWYCLSVRAKRTKSTVDEALGGGAGDITSYGYIYTCVDDVKKVSEIKESKTKTTYIIERDYRIVEYNESLIEENNKQIELLRSQITQYEADIKEIERERAFQTVSQRERSDSKIKQIKDSISHNNKNISTLEQKNTNLKETIREYKAVIWRLEQKN